MSSDLLLFSVGVLLALGTGVFVGSEFALLNLDRADLEARRAKGEKGFSITISALKRTSTHLSSAQLGITLTTLLTGYTMEPAISSMLSGPLADAGVPDDFVRPIGGVLGILLATFISMIFGELVPKNYALSVPRQTARVLVPLQVAFTWTFRPFIAFLNGSANRILRAMGIEPKEELSASRTADELSSLVQRSALQGLLEDDTATLLSRTIEFSSRNAIDVMTPRTRVEAVHRSDTAWDIIALANKTGFSRFPVIDESIDDVRGVVHVKQAIAVPVDKRSEVPASALQSEVIRVPETMTLDVLLTELRGRGYQVAIVVDEYGGTSGIATLEDLVEELMGRSLTSTIVLRSMLFGPGTGSPSRQHFDPMNWKSAREFRFQKMVPTRPSLGSSSNSWVAWLRWVTPSVSRRECSEWSAWRVDGLTECVSRRRSAPRR